MFLFFSYFFFALIVSFLCSITESVILSVPISYLKAQANQGKITAKILLKYKSHINQPLTAILTLNTLANTLGAAGVGAQGVRVFGDVYFGIISGALALMILIFSEIIPKTLGATYYRELSAPVARLLQFMLLITHPLVIALSFITRVMTRRKRKDTTSREELAALAAMITEQGLISEKENHIIQNIVRLKDIKVSAIMTPRVVVAIADETMPLREFLIHKNLMRFSRIPVYQENPDNVTGYVFRTLVFEKLAEESGDLQLKDLRRDILALPESATLFSAWETLLHNREHIALIVDEYGGMEGILTLEDIIETLLAIEIVDEKDTVADMQILAMERWKAKQEKYKQYRASSNSLTE